MARLSFDSLKLRFEQHGLTLKKGKSGKYEIVDGDNSQIVTNLSAAEIWLKRRNKATKASVKNGKGNQSDVPTSEVDGLFSSSLEEYFSSDLKVKEQRIQGWVQEPSVPIAVVYEYLGDSSDTPLDLIFRKLARMGVSAYLDKNDRDRVVIGTSDAPVWEVYDI
ncbi:MAG: hypothetical protein F6J86_27565 [Symploca sp. SIO1B1]|nr:hypothetical protein [Symploca sp. SIO1B1]